MPSVIQIPQLPAATSAESSDLLHIRQGSVDKRITKSNFLGALNNDKLKGILKTTGSNSAYILTTGEGNTTLSIPMGWVWRSNHTNTGACTLQVDSATSVPMVDLEGDDFIAGDMDTTGVYFTVYDGSKFVAINVPWSATETRKGMAEQATVAECDTGTDTERFVTPQGLLSSILANAPTASPASTILQGIVELATNTEAQEGVDTTRAITPSALASVTATETRAGLVTLATDAEASAGVNTEKYISPAHLATAVATAVSDGTGGVPAASTIISGIVELATAQEVQGGSDTIRAVTPAALSTLTANENRRGLAKVATQAEVNAGIGDDEFVSPSKLSQWERDATEAVKGFVQRASDAEALAGVNTEKYLTPSHLSGLGVTGAIIMMGSTVVPEGHLECNGANVSRTTYANLYSKIGNTWGSGDGSTTFSLPDLRGEFVRGWDHSRGVDSGRQAGSSQADSLKSHRHSISNILDNAPAGANYNAVFADENVYGERETFTNYEGSSETRPRNVSVMYCIKK